MKKFVAFVLLLVLALVFIGCEMGGGEVVPTKVSITESSLELEVGKNYNLGYSVEPKDAANKLVEWKSSDAAIVTVDQNGRLTAVAEGEATITATSKAVSTLSASIKVTVIPVKLEDLTKLTISGSSTVMEGKDVAFKAIPTPAGASNEVEWSLTAAEGVTASDIATIDAQGVLSVKASGNVTVVATSKVNPEITATYRVTCVSTADIIHIISVSLSASEYEVAVGANKTVGISFVGPTSDTGTPKTPTNRELHWTSSNEEVATAEGTTIKGVGAGTATLTYETDDKGVDGNSPFTGTITVTVFVPEAPTSWTAKAKSTKIETGIEVGSKVNIDVEVGGTREDSRATFASDNEAIATVDENGTVTGITPGTVTITVTSVADPTKSDTVTIKFIEKQDDHPDPESVTVTGEDEMFVGYKQQLVHTVLPLNAVQTVTWSSTNESLATVDETGLVTALAAGTVRIKATSVVTKKVTYSFRIVITVEPPRPPVPNMGGYEIIIMNAASALSDNDPFLEAYSGADKTYKQKAWREVESEYNCKITVKAYPEEAPWGNPRINWIKEHASTNTSECDLGIVSSNWIHEFAKTSSGVDVTSFYNTYGKKQMDPALKQAGTFKNKLYVASTGLTTTAVNVDLGLYYNYGLLKRLGLDDPATLFNEGKWNYTGFEKWVREAQAALGDTKKALGGHPYYYYYGMTNAAGVKIADVMLNSTNIRSASSREAMNLMAKLTQDGCVSTANTWGESKTAEGNDFFDEGVLMITGCLWFVRASNRWADTNGLVWEGTPEFGYVPFPYPDSVDKANTRIGTSGLSVYLYVAGRNYPAGVTTEAVYDAMNEMFLRTHKYQEADETFNARDIIYNSLKSRIDNDASIEAIMYYDSSRTFFDPAHGIYGSTAGTRLRQPTIDVMFNGKDFDETFSAVEAGYEEDFLTVYG